MGRFFLLLAVSAVLVTGCAHQEQVNDMVTPAGCLGDKAYLSRWRELYSRDTLKVLDRLEETKDAGTPVNLLLPMGDGVEYRAEVLSRDEKKGRLRLTILRHPRENMRGAVMEVPMVLEDGLWRFDLSSEVRRGLDGMGR